MKLLLLVVLALDMPLKLYFVILFKGVKAVWTDGFVGHCGYDQWGCLPQRLQSNGEAPRSLPLFVLISSAT